MSDADLTRRRMLAGLAGALWGLGGTCAFTVLSMVLGVAFGFGVHGTVMLAMPAMGLVFAALMVVEAEQRSREYVTTSLRLGAVLTVTSLALLWLLLVLM